MTSDEFHKQCEVYQARSNEIEKYLRDNAETLTDLQTKELRKLRTKLRNIASDLNAESTVALYEELQGQLPAIKEATDDLDDAIKKVKKVKEYIQYATLLVQLGVAIAAGNAQAIGTTVVTIGQTIMANKNQTNGED